MKNQFSAEQKNRIINDYINKKYEKNILEYEQIFR